VHKKTAVAILLLAAMFARPRRSRRPRTEAELPKPMFIGTPTNIKSPNLEPSRQVARPFMVPAGTKLLSLKRPVTASDSAR